MKAGGIINALNIYNLYSECYQGPSDNMTRVPPPSLHLFPYMQQQAQVCVVKQHSNIIHSTLTA